MVAAAADIPGSGRKVARSAPFWEAYAAAAAVAESAAAPAAPSSALSLLTQKASSVGEGKALEAVGPLAPAATPLGLETSVQLATYYLTQPASDPLNHDWSSDAGATPHPFMCGTSPGHEGAVLLD